MYKLSEKLMGMDDATWKRHANPLSVYSRFTILPLLALSVWSRYWIGYDALIPFALTIFWAWINPRLFKAPASLDSWAARGVMGEQLFLQRKNRDLPGQHLRMANFLTLLLAIGGLVMAFGLWKFHPILTLGGLLLSMGAKTVFFARMVRLYDDVNLQSGDQAYR